MRAILPWLAGVALLYGCQGKSPSESSSAGLEPAGTSAVAEADAGGEADEGEAADDDDVEPDPPGSPAPQARALPAGSRNLVRFERAFIVDATGFERPLAASTLFLPHGWRWQGGVFWGQQFLCTNGYNFNWMASSPDGSRAVWVLPQAKWETNNYGAPPSSPGCPSLPYSNVRSYLQAVALGWKRGARVLDFRPRPDVARDFAQFNQRTPTALGEMRTWTEAGEVLIAFNEGGRDMRGSIGAAVMFSSMVADAGTGRMQSLTGFAFPAYAATAPNGQLDFAFFEAIRRSIKEGPEWSRRIANHNAQIGRVAIEESRKRADAIARSSAEIARIREEAWNSYQESADRRARQFSEALRGVTTYADADAPGGTAQLSNNFDHAWRLKDGSYVLTNDPGFEPWRDLKVEGSRLEAMR